MLPITLPLQFGNASRLFGNVCVPLGNAFRRCEQSQGDKLGALRVQPQYLALIQLAAHGTLHKRLCRTPFRLPWLHAALHNSASPNAQVYLS